MAVITIPGGSGGGASSGPLARSVLVLTSSHIVTSNEQAWTYDMIEIADGVTLDIEPGGSLSIFDSPLS